MANTVTTIGYGSTLEWSTDDGTTWTQAAEVVQMDLPVHTVNKVDATHMSSPDMTMEYVIGMREPNDVAFEINMNRADYEALYALEFSGTKALWRQKLPLEIGATEQLTYTFEGGVELSGGSVVVADVIRVSGSIKRTGKVTPSYEVPAP